MCASVCVFVHVALKSVVTETLYLYHNFQFSTMWSFRGCVWFVHEQLLLTLQVVSSRVCVVVYILHVYSLCFPYTAVNVIVMIEVDCWF